MNDMQVFGMERLEDRLLMAVNVTQTGSHLLVKGDDADNLIGIVGVGDGEVYVLIDEDGDGDMDLYGLYSGIKSVSIWGDDGDDDVLVYGLEIDGNLTVDAGDGADGVLVSEDYIGPSDIENVAINSGDGNDHVFLAGIEIDGKLTIDSGSGNDFGGLDGDQGFFSDILDRYVLADGDVDVAGRTLINTGDGYDYVGVGAAYYDVELGDLVIRTGAYHDFVSLGPFGPPGSSFVRVNGRTDINLGAGDDDVICAGYGVYFMFVGDFNADGGAGNDDLANQIFNASFGGKVTIKSF